MLLPSFVPQPRNRTLPSICSSWKPRSCLSRMEDILSKYTACQNAKKNFPTMAKMNTTNNCFIAKFMPVNTQQQIPKAISYCSFLWHIKKFRELWLGWRRLLFYIIFNMSFLCNSLFFEECSGGEELLSSFKLFPSYRMSPSSNSISGTAYYRTRSALYDPPMMHNDRTKQYLHADQRTCP